MSAMSAELVILVLLIATALAFDFTNGFHDTGNAMATSIATGALKPKTAVLLAGVRPDTLDLLSNVGLREWFPDERIFPEEDKEFSATLKAVRYAESRLVPGGVRSGDELYYLV